jgi:hypothetical protein
MYIDGEYLSGTAFSLPLGFRNVRVRVFGFEDESAAVMIMQDRTSVLEVEMKPAQYRISSRSLRTSKNRE